MAFIVSIIVQCMAVFLLGLGIATFVSLLKGCFYLRRVARAGRQDHGPIILKSPLVPAVSTIATPRDASAESLQFTRRLLDLHFGRNEVVIVLDGPSESELEVWSRELRLCPSARIIEQKLPTAAVRGVYESRDPVRVVVIDKARGGPIDAWNAGVNASSSPVIGLLDPETDFIPEVLLRLIQPMLESAEETVAVVGGVSAPPAEGTPAQFGSLESLRAWLTRGAVYATRNMTLPFPGSALLIRRAAVLQGGGFTGGTLELFVRMHGLALAANKPYRVAFFPEAVSHARTPRTMDELHAQVDRDQSEIAHAYHKRTALAGPFGWQLLGGLYTVRVIRPIVELVAYALSIIGLLTRWIDGYTFGLVLLSTIGVGVITSMAAVVLREFAEPVSPDERRMAAMFFAAIPENIGYRQLRSWWLLVSFFKTAKEPSPVPKKAVVRIPSGA